MLQFLVYILTLPCSVYYIITLHLEAKMILIMNLNLLRVPRSLSWWMPVLWEQQAPDSVYKSDILDKHKLETID